jgi:diguanylate cyclase (GGDEF)-like protein
LTITVSYGVAQVIPGDDAASVLRRADDALYRAKHGGRNRGYMHDGSDCRPVVPDVPTAPPRPIPPAPEVRLLFTLPDRQQLDQELKRRVSESQRYGLPLSLMCIQVLDVSRIAAQHGQRTLDLVLDVVAHRLQDTIREMDYLARESGDHFAVVLPGSTTAEARQVARRVETTQASQTVTIGDAAVKVGLVVGFASLQGSEDAASLRLRAEVDLANKRSEAATPVESLAT